MTALVETYEMTEMDADGNLECDAEAVALIEQLGLAGQQKLIKKDDSGEVSRIPYRKMTLEERQVYSAICPKKSKLKEYADDPIPLRVLQVAAHAQELFENIEVWSAADADIKDPILVGKNTVGHTDEFFMLARWGEVLEPFNKLREMAVSLCRRKRAGAFRKIIAECEAKLVATETGTEDYALSESIDPFLSDYGRRP